MPEISLYVTRGVVEHSTVTAADQRQIAYREASADIAERLRAANRDHRVVLQLGDLVLLTVGDTSAIWRSHNKERAADFDALFEMLARYPDRPMRFLCELV
jgi:hypothetical protein